MLVDSPAQTFGIETIRKIDICHYEVSEKHNTEMDTTYTLTISAGICKFKNSLLLWQFWSIF